MAELAISAHLPFVPRDKGDFPVGGHGFRRAQEVARAFRQDFFFAGDERNLIAALYRDDPLIHLPREEAQGKADHSGSVTAPARDRKMGFAGVRRPQYRSEAHTTELQSLIRHSFAVFCLT